MKHIFKCGKCNSYTLKDTHCGVRTLNPKPPKYAIEDPYGKYRRKAKEELIMEQGLI